MARNSYSYEKRSRELEKLKKKEEKRKKKLLKKHPEGEASEAATSPENSEEVSKE